MDAIRVIHDKEGRTLTVWFGDATREHTSNLDEDGVVIMKADDGQVLGVEILNFAGHPTAVSLEPSGEPREAST